MIISKLMYIDQIQGCLLRNALAHKAKYISKIF